MTQDDKGGDMGLEWSKKRGCNLLTAPYLNTNYQQCLYPSPSTQRYLSQYKNICPLPPQCKDICLLPSQYEMFVPFHFHLSIKMCVPFPLDVRNTCSPPLCEKCLFLTYRLTQSFIRQFAVVIPIVIFNFVDVVVIVVAAVVLSFLLDK